MSKNLVSLKPKQHPVTTLPKFTTELPFFYLTKQRELLTQPIIFQGQDTAGNSVRWTVTPNVHTSIGAPAIKAHEVWVKLIKPAIDDARNDGELSSIIPLGNVRECLRTLGWGIGGWEHERFIQSIRQVCFAACEADFWLPTTETDKEGKSRLRRIKGSFSRMTLYAIGNTHIPEEELRSEKFSFNFDLEDTIYIQLHPLEVEIQRHQSQRPIDNEYLFSVSPAARRWYELLAPSIFGVTNNTGPGYCEILYSWYVERHHTLKRQKERWQVAKQMNKITKDHKAFGYIERVEYTEVKKPGKEVDFIIRYYPGSGARESTKRIRSRTAARLVTAPPAPIQMPSPPQKPVPTSANPSPVHTDEQCELLRKLLEHGVHADAAAELVKASPEEVIRQLEYLPFRTVKKNTAGMLRKAIVERWTPPEEYAAARKREATQQEAQERVKRKKAEAETAEKEKSRQEALQQAYYEFLRGRLGVRRETQPEALLGFLNDESAKRDALESDPTHKGAAKKIYLRLFDDEESHLERFRDFFGEPNFTKWKQEEK